jgi:hypothetical protein
MACRREPVSRLRFAIGDGATDLSCDLLVQWSGIVAV